MRARVTERVAGLDNAAAIAAHAVTTAIAIGPYDLSHSLGYSEEMLGALAGEGRGPFEAAAVAQIKAAGEACGKTMWRIGDGAQLVREGFHFLCIGEPIAMMKGAMAAANQDAKAAPRL